MIAITHKPSSPLSSFIENYWLFDGYVPPHAREKILPSGTFELVFNLREDELRIYDFTQPATCRRYSGAVVCGPYAGCFGSDAVEEVSIMGIHFRPGGAFPFLGFPAGELEATHLNLADLWGPSAAVLRAQLIEAATPADRFRLMERALIRQMRRPLAHHPAVATALQLFGRHSERYGTLKLSRTVRLSERRFIDVFRTEVGLAPKLFGRILRFQRVLNLVQPTAVPDWTQLALACAYFDQSHLIRDFRQFTGLSPTDYLSRLRSFRERGIYTKRNHLPLADAL